MTAAVETFDLFVIGSGTAAMVGAMRARKGGWRVAVADFRPYGGTCALRGCDPKKMLLGGAAAVDYARRMVSKGVSGDPTIDWRELMAFKRSFTGPIPTKHENLYKDQQINTYHGRVRFTGRNSAEVDGQAIAARHFLIATGAEPVRLGIPGEENLTTSEGFLELPALPPRIALVGGGYIASEFSHLCARAGASVTVLHRGDRILARFDSDLVYWLMEVFRRIGVDVRTNTPVEAIEKRQGSLLVHAGGSAVEVDLAVHSAGRKPDFTAMNLDAAGIDNEHGKLRLNEFLQSVSNPAVYAAGDAASEGPPLTPVSSHDAKVAVANMMKGNHAIPDYSGVPSVAFTIPPIASVGMSETEAKASGLKVRIKSERTSNWFTAQQAAEPVSGYKTIVEESSDRLLGAHLVGPHADEVINLFGLAIRNGLTTRALKDTMFAYPTGASDIGYMV